MRNLFDYGSSDISEIEANAKKKSEDAKQNAQSNESYGASKWENSCSGDKREMSAEEIVGKYKDLPQDDLMSSLFEKVKKGKEDGSFDYSKIEDMCNNASKYLNAEQSQMLKSLLGKIK